MAAGWAEADIILPPVFGVADLNGEIGQ